MSLLATNILTSSFTGMVRICVQRNGQNDDVKVLNLSSKDDYASPQQPYVATTLSYSHSVRSTTTFVIAAFQLSSAKGGCLKTRKIAEF